jgi:hypothetical protein
MRERFHRFMQELRMPNRNPIEFDRCELWPLNRIALTHQLLDKIAAAYLRTIYLEKRQTLKEYWANLRQTLITVLRQFANRLRQRFAMTRKIHSPFSCCLGAYFHYWREQVFKNCSFSLVDFSHHQHTSC